MPKLSRTAVTANKAVKLKDYILTHPDSDINEVLKALQIKNEASLLRLLLGMGEDESVCSGGAFNINRDGKKITIQEVAVLLENTPEDINGPSAAERLIYLYDALNNSSPSGGITFQRLMSNYMELIKQSGAPMPKKESIRRSIHRDLEKLETYGIVIERPSTGSKKYRLADEYLPKLSPEAASGVYVSMLLYRNTLLNEATSSAREELEKSIFRESSQPQILKDRIYILGDTLAEPERFGNILGKLISSIQGSYRIKMRYCNNQGKETERILEPLGLVCKRGVWYLFANNKIDGHRTFRVDQIQSLRTRENERFEYPQGYSLQEQIKSSWGVFCNDEISRVRLKFSPAVAHRVQNLRYHISQQLIETCPDGSVILQFEVCGLLELQSWILQWSNQVEVLEPLILREAIREIAQGIADQYS